MSGQSAVPGIGWFGIVRLGAVQASIGAIVMLATSLLNRVMVVEFAVAAAIPAALVAWHYTVQLSRPVWGYRSDQSRQRSPWIIAGLGVLSLGMLLAVDATVMMSGGGRLPLILALIAFTAIGIGVGMAGTALLALLASRVVPERKPAAAAITWTMMVAGIVVAAAVSGSYLDPFSEARLAVVVSLVVLGAFSLAVLALYRFEANTALVASPNSTVPDETFSSAVRAIWADAQARRFTWFVFVSMVAYSMQDLILEPFAGLVFDFSPGESTTLAGLHHAGILVGMLTSGVGGTFYAKRFGQNVKLWIVLGCFGSAVMLACLSLAATVGQSWPLQANILGLGLANGVFAVAAVGAMLGLASDGQGGSEGARMGVWGAAQAIAFGSGGLLGAMIVDMLRNFAGPDSIAFATVFALEASMFVLAAIVAVGTNLTRAVAISSPERRSAGA
jgi:BCD family chlorophyll transporter-like MFS transporter